MTGRRHANEKHNSVLSGVCDRLSERVEELEQERDAEGVHRIRVYAENQTLRNALEKIFDEWLRLCARHGNVDSAISEAYHARDGGDENG